MSTRVNGGPRPGVFGAPTLAYFTVTPGADLVSDIGKPDTALEAIVETIQTKSTTFIIGAVTADGFRVATEPSAWSAADLEAAIQALGTVNGDNLSGATVDAFTF